MSLNSRVKLVSCFQFIPSFIFHLFPFCLSPVKFDIILFPKVEIYTSCSFFFLLWDGRKSAVANPSAQRQKKMKLDVRVGSSRVCSAQGLREILNCHYFQSPLIFFKCGYSLNLPPVPDKNKCSSIYSFFFFLWLSSHMYIHPRFVLTANFSFFLICKISMRFLATSFFGAHLFRCVALVYFF